MTIFVYEQITAALDAGHSLYREGLAMREAVIDDFRRLGDVEILAIPDGTSESDLGAIFDDCVRRSDGALLIAPETGGELLRLAERVLALGGKLLGPQPEAIQLSSDKFRLFEHWCRDGVPTPDTWVFDGSLPCLPAVLKPRDGAGSCETLLIRGGTDAIPFETPPGRFIIQRIAPGRAASVAFIVCNEVPIPLTPCFQSISNDGHFHYSGGSLPIPAALADRAIRLGLQAIDRIPGLNGYIGVDLILGETAAEDAAIEINPRLTTSYVGLLRHSPWNMAGLMLNRRVAQPIEAATVEFQADGLWSIPSKVREGP